MRIGLLTSVPSTIDAFFPAWVDAWRSAGHEVVPASGPGPDGAPARVAGSVVIDGLARTPASSRPLAAASGLRTWADSVDVVLTNTATASSLVRLSRPETPVVYFCHGLHWSGRPGPADVPYVAVERAFLQRTSAVVCLNGEDEEWFVRHAPRGVEVCRLGSGVGLDLCTFAAVAPPPVRGVLQLGWVGELAPRKRPFDALGVVALLRRCGVDVRLDMLGAGPLHDAVRDTAVRAGVSDRVVLPGRQDPRPALARCHALLHTAEWEGLPRVLLEAAAVGRPSFGYDVKGVRDSPGATVAGRPGDVAPLAAAVLRWWRAGAPPHPVDRARLDWREAQATVTDLLQRVAR